jgi:hypothetical protein
MLTLKENQLARLVQNAEDGFVKRALDHVAESFPGKAYSIRDPALRAFIVDSMKRAECFGLKSERQIMCFIDSECLLGQMFYSRGEHAWARKVLDSKVLLGDDKARLLLATACSLTGNK